MPPVFSSLPELKQRALNVENAVFYVLYGPQAQLPTTADSISAPIAVQTPHTHAYTELFFCYRGTLTLQCADYRLSLGEGDLVLVPPGVLHVKLPDVHGACEWSAVGFLCVERPIHTDHDLYTRVSALSQGHEPLLLRDVPHICALSRTAARASGEASGASHELLADLRLVEILTHVADALSLTLKTERPPSPKNRDIRRAAILENIITTQFMHNWTVPEAAALLCVCPRQLERIVKLRYGMSLREALINMRVKIAAQMLRDPDLSVEQISLAVGFPSRSSFERNFARSFGKTPLQYRAQLAQE